MQLEISFREVHTFLHVFCLLETFLDVCLVSQVGFGRECFVKARAEVVEAQWVFASEIEQL
jgi:hypothetical protein